MTRNFMLRRNRATVAVLASIFIAACSDTLHEPTSPKALPAIPLRSPVGSFSYQEGSKITVYHDQGGWVQLDAAANTLTDHEGTVIPLTDDQKVEFLNDFQGTVVSDQLANAVQGFTGCEFGCVEPTSVPLVPSGSPQPSSGGKIIVEVVETTKVKTKPTDRFGIVAVDLDKQLKELSKAAKKSGNAGTLEWPPNCGTALVEVRAAKDNYISGRNWVSDGIIRLYKSIVGLFVHGVAGKVATEMPELSEKFVMKRLAQQNMSLIAAIYSGICGQSIPVGTAGYGWYPGAILVCNEVKERISIDGGVNWFWSTVRTCEYHAAR